MGDTTTPRSEGPIKWVCTIGWQGKTTAWANRRVHWRAASSAKKREKAQMRRAWIEAGRPIPPTYPCRVTFTRYSVGRLDSDNLPTAFKYHRDELADLFGLKNDAGPEVDWQYAQVKIKRGEPARVKVTIASVLP